VPQPPAHAQSHREARQWKPSPGLALVWLVTGGFLATLYAATHGGSAQFNLPRAHLALIVATFVAIILVLCATHELIRGASLAAAARALALG
jgi:hypothetical protein